VYVGFNCSGVQLIEIFWLCGTREIRGPPGLVLASKEGFLSAQLVLHAPES
jgi:hypothetical protein